MSKEIPSINSIRHHLAQYERQERDAGMASQLSLIQVSFVARRPLCLGKLARGTGRMDTGDSYPAIFLNRLHGNRGSKATE